MVAFLQRDRKFPSHQKQTEVSSLNRLLGIDGAPNLFYGTEPVVCVTERNRMSVVSSASRLGDFWKILSTNFRSKVAQMFGDFLGNLENH